MDAVGIKKKEEKALTLREHLEELRRRLLWSAIAVVIAIVISFIFAGRIFEFFQSLAPEGTVFIVLEVTEQFSVYMQVCLYSGFVIALPLLIYQLVMFVRPALTREEKRYLYVLLPGIVLFFFAGAAFAYYVFLPPAIKFLIDFSVGDDVITQVRLGPYISMVAKMLLVMGLVFELPIVIYFLSRIGVITSAGLSRFRKLAYVGAFVLSAIITPTVDPVNQTIVAVPIIILYELGILLARLAQIQRRRSESRV